MSLDTGSVSSALREEDRQRFERDGFLVLDGLCPLDLIDDVRTEIEGVLKDPWDPGPQVEVDGVVYDRYHGRQGDWHWHRVKNAWKISDNVRALALNPTVLETTEALFGRKVMPFQTLNFPVGTQQRPHSDSFHFQSDPSGFMCGVWIALEDMDMDNGPLMYYPGSQRLPIPTWDEVEGLMGEALKESDYPSRAEFMAARNAQYEQYCQRLIERENLEPEYATISKGQAVLWAPNLLHGGSPQTDPSRTRHSQVTHYFFEGCRVYTPLHTEDGHNYWNYPEWIRDPVPVYSPEMLSQTIAEQTPSGSSVLFFSAGMELPSVEGRTLGHFPQDAEGRFVPGLQDGSDAVEALESTRSQGFDFFVIPKEHLIYVEYTFPTLQAHLEERFTAVLRDGAVCAIYELD